MPAIVTQGIVLRHAPYKDYDYMITLLSPQQGRIDAIVRGARRPKSGLTNAGELFCAGEYTLNVRAGRYSVTQCHIQESFYQIRSDYDRLIHGAYHLALCEAAIQPGQPAEGLFHLLLKSLAHLCHSDLPLELVTLLFELSWAQEVGISPGLERCVYCGEKVAGGCRFDAHAGGVVCGRCESYGEMISLDARRLLYILPLKGFESLDQYLPYREAWAEAARRIRPYILAGADKKIHTCPDLP